MDQVVRCPSCQASQSFGDIVPFRAECERCSADLHVCLNCRFYDRYVENQCREDAADPVANKDRRNLCEYWKPVGIGDGAADAAAAAKAKLAALFGEAPPATTPASPSSSTPISGAPAGAEADGKALDPAEEAKRKLAALFGGKS